IWADWRGLSPFGNHRVPADLPRDGRDKDPGESPQRRNEWGKFGAGNPALRVLPTVASEPSTVKNVVIINDHAFVNRGQAKAVSDGTLPHVYTLHEYFLACPNGGFFDYQAQALCTRRPLGAA